MANGRCHPANLAVSPLCNGKRQPGIINGFPDTDWRIARPNLGRRKGFRLGGSRFAILKVDAAAKRLENRRIWSPLNLDPIGFRQFVFRMSDTGLEATVVCQDKESFRIPIEPARRVNAGHINIVRECFARARRLTTIRKL